MNKMEHQLHSKLKLIHIQNIWNFLNTATAAKEITN